MRMRNEYAAPIGQRMCKPVYIATLKRDLAKHTYRYLQSRDLDKI